MNFENWISVKDEMPKEYESYWAKYKGTSKWMNGMWSTESDDVLVTVEFENGTRITDTSYLRDGEWRCENDFSYTKKKVVAWMPYPEEYKGD